MNFDSLLMTIVSDHKSVELNSMSIFPAIYGICIIIGIELLVRTYVPHFEPHLAFECVFS